MEENKIKIPTVEIVDLSLLSVDKNNPNVMTKAQRAALWEGMQKFGVIVPIITNKDGLIADGQNRCEVLLEHGVTKGPVVKLPITDIDRRILRQVLNKLKGSHDPVLDDSEYKVIFKQDQFGELQRLLGESDKKLVQFMASIEKGGLNEDSLDVDSARANPVYKIELGEVWQLGDHRLMCGDSTKSEDVEKLMQGEKADMVFTDPPYGINIVNSGNADISAKVGFGKVSNWGEKGLVEAKVYPVIKGDDKPFNPEFILNLAPKILIFGANNFSSKLPDNSHWIVWDKKAGIGADHNNFSDAELIWTNIQKKSVPIYRYLWSGLLRAGKREIELKERVHPTQKPVGLLIEILKDYSKEKEIVLDLFGGSGSTLIAAEKTNRKCFMMEIDSAYCSVIIERWEKVTGLKAKKLEESVVEEGAVVAASK